VITVPRVFPIALASVFSAYHVFLALYSLGQLPQIGPSLVAVALYAVATSITLWSTTSARMPVWMAAFDLAVCIAIPLLVTSELDASASNGYATWHVAAVGTLMTIVAVRRRQVFAWLGVGFLTLQTVLWSGNVLSLGGLGVIGSVVWVAAAVLMTHALARAARDAQRFVRAEQQGAQWQAAQEAHLSERQRRLASTYRMAAPILTEIVQSGGNLTGQQRQECRLLEATMRDEIRGRQLLDDAVRREVRAARRRGTTVTLLDEGGLDDLAAEDRDDILQRLAAAIRHARVDTLIVRTVPRSMQTAVTVVGLRTSTTPHVDDEVELWLEIPRVPQPVDPPVAE
jgi:hypothetical protein